MEYTLDTTLQIDIMQQHEPKETTDVNNILGSILQHESKDPIMTDIQQESKETTITDSHSTLIQEESKEISIIDSHSTLIQEESKETTMTEIHNTQIQETIMTDSHSTKIQEESKEIIMTDSHSSQVQEEAKEIIMTDSHSSQVQEETKNDKNRNHCDVQSKEFSDGVSVDKDMEKKEKFGDFKKKEKKRQLALSEKIPRKTKEVSIRPMFFCSNGRTKNPLRATLSKMLTVQQRQLSVFRKKASKNHWSEIHHDHYDWYMFPIEDGSQRQYNVLSNDVEELKSDPNWYAGYLEAVELVAKAWGWDVKKKNLFNPCWMGWVGRIGM